MRIAYAVHGYGRGHSSRALAILPELAGRHELLILAGGDAYNALSVDYPVVRIPYLAYAIKDGGKRAVGKTLWTNTPAVLDLITAGPISQMVTDALRAFEPDAILTDSEPWTHHAAGRLGMGRISFDHFAALAYCDWPVRRSQRLPLAVESLTYKRLMGVPQRMVVASFYSPPPNRPGVKVVGPVLRQIVRTVHPREGDYLLVYFTRGRHYWCERMERALKGVDIPIVCYGVGKEGVEGNITFKAPSNDGFVRDLAGARAVYSTGGNQLISEAVHFGKPMLIMPEDALEQQINADTIQRLSYGRRVDRHQIGTEVLLKFWENVDRYREAIPAGRIDGAAEAVEAIEMYAEQLRGVKP